MSSDVKEGHVFGDRYEIQHKIARGGMADVYLARDKLLDRPVALKVLFPELSVDPSFVERFRREAQNAAKLSHPNIVSVYDWGENNRTYFIVMEYVDGKSLAAILKDDGPMSSQRAATIGAEVASALAFAHRNGVVHRDVKPGNVLIDDRGSVKVTDFGIARARNTTENLTQTGAVMGTATYFSPEQAQGLAVDQRSDVYSLGVVLYEMVAGSAPFKGDNPVTIALQHVRETPRPLSSVQPKVPAPFEAIVAEAMAKSTSNRYASAEALRADLDRFLRNQPVQATMLTGPPVDATRAVPTAAARQAYADNTRAMPPGRAPTRPPPDEGNGLKGPLLALLALLALLGIGALLLFTNNSLTTKSEKPVSVPAVVGKQLDEAQRVLKNAKLKSSVTRQADDAPADTVIAQDPAANAASAENSTVRLTVSEGPAPVTVPDVRGRSLESARNTLSAAGFKVESSQAASDDIEKGNVISQSPAPGREAKKGDTVTLTVSSGPRPIRVPNVVGFTESTAAETLSNAGLRTASVSQASDQPRGTVLSSSPASGSEVSKGSTVTITVSSGQAETTQPTLFPTTTDKDKAE